MRSFAKLYNIGKSSVQRWVRNSNPDSDFLRSRVFKRMFDPWLTAEVFVAVLMASVAYGSLTAALAALRRATPSPDCKV